MLNYKKLCFILLILLVSISAAFFFSCNNPQMMSKPGVGAAVILLQDGKILLGKRKNSPDKGTWAPPGGKLEFGEELQDCAKREVLEETGIEILELQDLAITNDIFEKDHMHYVCVLMLSKKFKGSPKLMEPDKCEDWQWFDVNNLPNDLFLAIRNLLQQGKKIE